MPTGNSYTFPPMAGKAFSLKNNDTVQAKLSSHSMKLVRLSKKSFCEILDKKWLWRLQNMKNDRQKTILSIIAEETVETQEQLLSLLLERGIVATQATISRDIKQLHLVKAPAGQGSTAMRYPTMGQRSMWRINCRPFSERAL